MHLFIKMESGMWGAAEASFREEMRGLQRMRRRRESGERKREAGEEDVK